MNLQKTEYFQTLQQLKERIRHARRRATFAVNEEMLKLYWEIGNTILQQQEIQGWGAKIVENLASDLKSEFPDFKGLSLRNLKYMRAFAEAYPEYAELVQPSSAQSQGNVDQDVIIVQASPAQLNKQRNTPIVQATLAQLTWYHHCTLLDKIKDKKTRLFYVQQTAENGWSRDVMVHQIESGLHGRIGKIPSSFNSTMANEESELVQQVFKDPYKFDFICLGREAKERDLEDALCNQLTKFLLELGQHFAFLGRQYKLSLGEKEYFFDLLFYHTRLKRYIVIELKIDEFKPEYKGKMEFYLNLADDYLKQKEDEKSIGIILCKTHDRLVVEYALRETTRPIGVAEYQLGELLPENIKGELPSIEELEERMEKEYEELKGPGDKKWDSLRQKLAAIGKPRVEVPITHERLCLIFDKSLHPLFEFLLEKLKSFHPEFMSHSCFWTGPINITELDQVGDAWKEENILKQNRELKFFYRLYGLRALGIDSFDVYFQLNFLIDNPYWWGFSMFPVNENQPFLRKLYNEQLTREEIEYIWNIIQTYIVDEIDKRVNFVEQKK